MLNSITINVTFLPKEETWEQRGNSKMHSFHFLGKEKFRKPTSKTNKIVIINNSSLLTQEAGGKVFKKKKIS